MECIELVVTAGADGSPDSSFSWDAHPMLFALIVPTSPLIKSIVRWPSADLIITTRIFLVPERTA